MPLSTTAVEDGQAWIVSYAISLDRTWTTRSAEVTGQAVAGTRQVRLEADGQGRWRVDGQPAPAFGFSCRLLYDEAGLVLDYPGIAIRAA